MAETTKERLELLGLETFEAFLCLAAYISYSEYRCGKGPAQTKLLKGFQQRRQDRCGHCSRAHFGSGVIRPRPHDRSFYWVCVRACGQQETGCACPALTIPGSGSSPIRTPRHDQPKITEGAVDPLGGVRPVRPMPRAPAVREAPNRDRPTAPAGRSGPRPPRSRCAGPEGQAVAPGTRPARRHSLPPRRGRLRARSTR
jgi:hypothetical protein